MTRPPIQLPERISHDFRTPLTVIKEYACIMRDGLVGDVSAKQRNMLNVIDDRADDIHRLVDDLLFLAQPDARSVRMDGSPLHLRGLLEQLLEQFADKADRVGCQIKLKSDVSDGAKGQSHPQCFADEQQLLHVFRNVLSFAVKNRGGVDVVDVSLQLRVINDEIQVSLPVVLDSDAPCGDDIPAVDLGVGLDVAQQICTRNFGRLRIERSGAGEETESASITVSVPIYRPDNLLPRYRDWFNESPTASHADLLLIRSPLSPASRSSGLGSVLRYALGSSELLLPMDDGAWLLVSPCCINRIPIKERIDELRGALDLDFEYTLAQRRVDLQADDIQSEAECLMNEYATLA